jgi:hypothetical protein
MNSMGFDEVRTVALRPANRVDRTPKPFRAVDALLARFPTLSRRFLYIGTRSRDPLPDASEGWWAVRLSGPGM